jgi:hypothetical protein
MSAFVDRRYQSSLLIEEMPELYAAFQVPFNLTVAPRNLVWRRIVAEVFVE